MPEALLSRQWSAPRPGISAASDPARGLLRVVILLQVIENQLQELRRHVIDGFYLASEWPPLNVNALVKHWLLNPIVCRTNSLVLEPTKLSVTCLLKPQWVRWILFGFWPHAEIPARQAPFSAANAHLSRNPPTDPNSAILIKK